MITSGSCPRRNYRITGVSPRRHSATDDFADALPQDLRVSWSTSRRGPGSTTAAPGESP